VFVILESGFENEMMQVDAVCAQYKFYCYMRASSSQPHVGQKVQQVLQESKWSMATTYACSCTGLRLPFDQI
jgi:hypothetical protein